MAVGLLGNEVSDLCIGKPALRSVSVSATIAEALAALKQFGESYLSIWSCDLCCKKETLDCVDCVDCRCVGKVCMVDIVCFLCKEENLACVGSALQNPVSVLLPEVSGLVRHLETHSSLQEAIDIILEGAQHIVVPIYSRTNTASTNSRRKFINRSSKSTLHNNREYCWLSQEDIIRYLLNYIGLFCPMAIRPINSLNIIDTDNILAVHYDDPASVALPLIAKSLLHQSSVAIVDIDDKLIGEISPFTLNSCDESVSAAIATLTAGDLMAYIDCGSPPEDLIQLVKERLKERNLGEAPEFMDEDSGISSLSSQYSSSSDEEFGSGRSGRLGGYSARLVRRSEAIVCYPWSSLMAVMIQALAHRVSYVWVVKEDGTLAGTVTFTGMLKVFRERLKSMA